MAVTGLEIDAFEEYGCKAWMPQRKRSQVVLYDNEALDWPKASSTQ
jgi:hypothetical protein